VTLATTDRVGLDLELRALASVAGSITGVAMPLATAEDHQTLLDRIATPLDTIVINPSPVTLDLPTDRPGSHLAPQNAVAIARAAVERMRNRGTEGSVVFITGIKSTKSDASAHAFLETEMERLARDCAPNAIRVNAVAPGHVEINRKRRGVSSRAAPLGHVSVHPIEVGKAVWFLINDNLSPGITGTTLKTDRGASLLQPEW
jgi:NAD(P)-dependent dehydrogenase (short-subunit alcohol dehydrogenase family)